MRLLGFAVLGIAVTVIIPSRHAFADEVAEQLKTCRAISDPASRVGCYDRLVDRLPSAPQSVVQPRAPQQSARPAQPVQPTQPLPTPAPPVAKTPTERFGEADLPVQKKIPAAEQPPDVLVAQVTAVRTDASGYGVFTLDNGQVWRQTEASSLKIRSGARVKIKSGMMGAFYMSLEDGNKSFRARRVN